MITKLQSYDVNYKGARVNVLALSDSHGNFMKIPKVLKTVETHVADIYAKADSPSTLNTVVIGGDWFINPIKKGFITHPELSNGDVQSITLLKMIDHIRSTISQYALKISKSVYPSMPMKNILEIVFASGNHDLDGGNEFLLKTLKKLPMVSLFTNLKTLNGEDANLPSIEISNDIKEKREKLCKSVVYAIPDDKQKGLVHKVMFVSATIPSIDFYSPGQCKGFEFYDNCNRKDSDLLGDDIKGTINSIKSEVENFKKENPKGGVILVSHMGGRLSEIIRENIPAINHILNGHDHKNIQSNLGNTSINSLGKDFEMIKAVNFKFDDEGNFYRATMTPYFTDATLADGLENHPYQKFLDEFLAKDLESLISLKEYKTEKDEKEAEQKLNVIIQKIFEEMEMFDFDIQSKILSNSKFKAIVYSEAEKRLYESESVEKPLNKLAYGNEIRYQNSYLTNYLTSAVKRTIRETIDPEIFAVGLQTSIVRGPLEDGANNLGVMKVFDGVSENLSNIHIGKVKGEELVGLIIENVKSNLKDKTRNTIISWSDIQVNRSLVEAIENGKINADYSDAIRVRNKITKQFEPIDLDEEYKIAIGEKYIVKNDIEWPAKIRDRFTSLNKTYDEIFREYISSVDYKLQITPKTKEKRIL